MDKDNLTAKWGEVFMEARTMRASEDIFNQIETVVLNHELKSGDRLPSEREMMKIFGRSRATVREALRMLERRGLIAITPGLGGAKIREYESKNVSEPFEIMLHLNKLTPLEFFEFREVTEVAAVRWAAIRRNDMDLFEIEKSIKLEEIGASNWEGFHNADVDFHQAIIRSGNNGVATIIYKVLRKVLVDVISRGFKNLSLVQRKEIKEATIQEHKNIFSAIVEKDPVKAEIATKQHLLQFKSLFLVEKDTEN
ncbi:MAG: hypothetical protein VR72_02330 [Clostridiaceae bacterium BRH_c20a]|nr:MAG: hypothetical protein VR72_02330 [Clostridiaceae bacterium BRH_c20a]